MKTELLQGPSDTYQEFRAVYLIPRLDSDSGSSVCVGGGNQTFRSLPACFPDFKLSQEIAALLLGMYMYWWWHSSFPNRTSSSSLGLFRKNGGGEKLTSPLPALYRPNLNWASAHLETSFQTRSYENTSDQNKDLVTCESTVSPFFLPTLVLLKISGKSSSRLWNFFSREVGLYCFLSFLLFPVPSPNCFT